MQIHTPLSKPTLGSVRVFAASGTTRIAESKAVCLLLAVGLILLLFGDVVFLGTSLAPIDYDEVLTPSCFTLPASIDFPGTDGT